MTCMIGFHALETGADFKVLLSPLRGGLPVNTGGTTAEEIRERQYVATITQDVPVNRYQADILRDGVVIGGGQVDVKGEGTYWIGDVETNVEVSVDAGDLAEPVASQVIASLSSTKAIHLKQPGLIGNRLSSPLVRGDSYLHNADPEQSRAIHFSRIDFPDIPNGSTAQLILSSTSGDEVQTYSFAASIVSQEGTKVIRVQLTSSQTATIPVGNYLFNVTVFFPDGNSACFVGPNAEMEIIPRANAAAP